VNRNRAAVARAEYSRYLFPIFFLAMGALMLIESFNPDSGPFNFHGILGIILLIVGIAHLFVVRRVHRA
jgi:hypothetical protein